MSKSRSLAGAELFGTCIKQNGELRGWTHVVCTGNYLKTQHGPLIQVLENKRVRWVMLWTFTGIITRPERFRVEFVNGMRKDALCTTHFPDRHSLRVGG